jgi:hypothetical protein
MCNCEDDLKRIPKYKPNIELFDKIVMGLVLTTMVICVGVLIYGIFEPMYLMC